MSSAALVERPKMSVEPSQQSTDKAPSVAKVPRDCPRFPLNFLETFCLRNHKLPWSEGSDERWFKSTKAHWGRRRATLDEFQSQPGSLRRLPRRHIAHALSFPTDFSVFYCSPFVSVPCGLASCSLWSKGFRGSRLLTWASFEFLMLYGKFLRVVWCNAQERIKKVVTTTSWSVKCAPFTRYRFRFVISTFDVRLMF